jgi:hypothetical protein
MPITLANPQSGEDLAAQNIATGEPTDFFTNFHAAWNSSMVNDRIVGNQQSLEEAYDNANDKIFASSGQRMPNPARGELPPGMSQKDATGFPESDVTGDHVQIPTEMAAQIYEAYARKIGMAPPNLSDIQRQAEANRYGAEQSRNAVAARATTGGSIGSFLGSAGAIMTDPPVLASMLFGGPETSTFLEAIGREALIAGSAEAVSQPQIQTARIQAGLPGGVVQGLENVGMAAGGAAAFTTLLKGAGASYRALRDRALTAAPETTAGVDTARYVERYADLQGQNPLVATPEAAAEHVDRVSTAQRRLYDLEPDSTQTALSDSPVAAVRPAAELPTRPAIDLPDEVPAAATAKDLGKQLADAAKSGAESLDALKRAQDTANNIAPNLDDETLDMVRRSAPNPPKDDPSLVQAIIARGGVNDADGALAAVGVTPRSRPGLISRSGGSASDMSETLNELGYFPPAGPGEGSRVVDQRELAQHIADELAGEKLYARHGGGGNPDARAAYEQNLQLHGDLNQAFDDLGIDARRMSNQDIRDQVEGIASAPSPTPERRMDWHGDAVQRAVKANHDLDYAANDAERYAIASENDLREIYRDRMDEPIYLDINGETHAVAARDVFQALEDGDKLVREFGNCINGVPF